MFRVRRNASYDELALLPDGLTGELLGGELFATPSLGGDHALTSSSLGADLGPPFVRGRGGPGGWWITRKPELHLDADVLVPDYAGWLRSRMGEYPAGVGIAMRPDWVCEITAPSILALDRVRKLPIYARKGVPHAWIIDPVAHTLEVLRSSAATGPWSRRTRVTDRCAPCRSTLSS